MNFPARGVEIIQALYHANPQDDDARRIDIQKVGSQMAYELGPNWGNKKRAGLSDDFRSPDTIAFKNADDTLDLWDIQASSGQILVGPDQPPNHSHVPAGDATFMPCPPVNLLGGNPLPGEVPPPIGNPPTVDLTPVLVALANLQAIVEQLRDTPDPVVTVPKVTFPNYKGAIFGYGITLKPEGQ